MLSRDKYHYLHDMRGYIFYNLPCLFQYSHTSPQLTPHATAQGVPIPQRKGSVNTFPDVGSMSPPSGELRYQPGQCSRGNVRLAGVAKINTEVYLTIRL